MHDSTTMNDDDDDDNNNTLYVKGTSVTHPLLIHAPSNFFNSASSAFAGLVNTCLTSTVRYPRISGTGTGVPSVSVRKWGEKTCEKKKSVPFNAPTQIVGNSPHKYKKQGSCTHGQTSHTFPVDGGSGGGLLWLFRFRWRRSTCIHAVKIKLL